MQLRNFTARDSSHELVDRDDEIQFFERGLSPGPEGETRQVQSLSAEAVWKLGGRYE
jgi:hypothetical protein